MPQALTRPCLPNTPFIEWSYQPALLWAFAQDRELEQGPLLHALGMRAAPAMGTGCRLSAAQLLALLAKLQHLCDAPETAFVLGQSWLPGHYGPASHALQEAATLGEALTLLCEQSGRLCPLLAPRLVHCGDDVLLYWVDAVAQAGVLRPFVVDLHMSAVRAACEWLGGETLPWRYHFNRTRPRRLEQHEVYLGPDLQFDCHLDAMRLPATCLQRPWPRHRPVSAAAARHALAAQEAVPQGLLAQLYDHLLAEVRARPADVGLERAANHFGLSEATLKRHLSSAGSHFQAELDQVQGHWALYLMHEHGWGNEALARGLGFYDRANFRRAFKRWMGQTPSSLRVRWRGAT